MRISIVIAVAAALIIFMIVRRLVLANKKMDKILNEEKAIILSDNERSEALLHRFYKWQQEMWSESESREELRRIPLPSYIRNIDNLDEVERRLLAYFNPKQRRFTTA